MVVTQAEEMAEEKVDKMAPSSDEKKVHHWAETSADESVVKMAFCWVDEKVAWSGEC